MRACTDTQYPVSPSPLIIGPTIPAPPAPRTSPGPQRPSQNGKDVPCIREPEREGRPGGATLSLGASSQDCRRLAISPLRPQPGVAPVAGGLGRAGGVAQTPAERRSSGGLPVRRGDGGRAGEREQDSAGRPRGTGSGKACCSVLPGHRGCSARERERVREGREFRRKI